jgi:hypothetical protein
VINTAATFAKMFITNGLEFELPMGDV